MKVYVQMSFGVAKRVDSSGDERRGKKCKFFVRFVEIAFLHFLSEISGCNSILCVRRSFPRHTLYEKVPLLISPHFINILKIRNFHKSSEGKRNYFRFSYVKVFQTLLCSNPTPYTRESGRVFFCSEQSLSVFCRSSLSSFSHRKFSPFSFLIFSSNKSTRAAETTVIILQDTGDENGLIDHEKMSCM
jgi:hypothetical protein